MTRIAHSDDSPLVQRFVRSVLEKAGYEVEAWYPIYVSEVSERMQRFKPDLILSDYSMPGCNGLTLARLVRAERPEIPIIILTSSHDKEVEKALIRFGVQSVIHKPIDGPSLLREIETVLSTNEEHFSRRRFQRFNVDSDYTAKFQIKKDVYEDIPLKDLGLGGCCMAVPSSASDLFEKDMLFHRFIIHSPRHQDVAVQARLAWLMGSHAENQNTARLAGMEFLSMDDTSIQLLDTILTGLDH